MPCCRTKLAFGLRQRVLSAGGLSACRDRGSDLAFWVPLVDRRVRRIRCLPQGPVAFRDRGPARPRPLFQKEEVRLSRLKSRTRPPARPNEQSVLQDHQ